MPHVNVGPFKELRKILHRIASSLMYKFTCVMQPPSVHLGVWFHRINLCLKVYILEEGGHQECRRQRDVDNVTRLTDFETFVEIVQLCLFDSGCHVKSVFPLLLYGGLELCVVYFLVIVVTAPKQPLFLGLELADLLLVFVVMWSSPLCFFFVVELLTTL